MARIREKVKKGNPYYYLVENRRVGPNKTPREIILEYIGTAKNLMEFATKQYNLAQASVAGSSDTAPGISFKSYEHGSVMAMYKTAVLVGLEDIFDQCFKQRKLKEMTRSRILLLAIIHRIIDPGSKMSFAEWAKKTSLPYHFRFNPDDLSSQTIWEAMDGITLEQINQANQMLLKRILQIYPTAFSYLHLDYSNYFTFIDSQNNRCEICKRGHNKQKRDDLRQFSLALITSPVLRIPMIWELYEGNKNDKTEFVDFTSHAARELRAFGFEDLKEITLTFDGGSNSESNFADLPFNFICAHTITGFPELYDIDVDQYRQITLRNGHTRCAYQLNQFAFSGITGTGVLTFSQALYDGQMAELEKDILSFSKAHAGLVASIGHPRGKLAQLLRNAKKEYDTEVLFAEKYNHDLQAEIAEQRAKGIARRGKQKKEKPIPVWDEKNVIRELVLKELLKGRKGLEAFISIEVVFDENKPTSVKYLLDEEKKQAYIRKYFGKKLICSSKTDHDMTDILSIYAEQECIENLFKVSKDPDHFSVRPQFHWTDQKIRVHVMMCMMALSIAEVFRRKTEDAGSIYTKEALIDKLSTIRDGWLIRDLRKVDRVLEDMDEEQKTLMAVVDNLLSA